MRETNPKDKKLKQSGKLRRRKQSREQRASWRFRSVSGHVDLLDADVFENPELPLLER
jgi:hypothetical protein